MADEIPSQYMQLHGEQPALMHAYEAFGKACGGAGTLPPKTVALVKLAISLGAALEGAAHSHARKAVEAGWTKEDLLHVAHLCAPTIGFPPMMRSRQWVLDVVDESRQGKKRT